MFPLSTLEPVIHSSVRIIIDFVVRIIVVCSLVAAVSGPGTFCDYAAGRE
jgi:hypothetical protein